MKREERFEVSGFGSKTQTYRSKRGPVAVALQNGDICMIEANTIEKITAEVESVREKEFKILLETSHGNLKNSK